VILRDVTHDTEPESGAAGLARSTGIDAVEAFEDAFEVFGGNTHALVLDRDQRDRPDALTLIGDRGLDAIDGDADESTPR